MKRILILSDLHCGHRYGLAHPQDLVNKDQHKAWAFIEEGLKKHSPYDGVFVNGDAIDGKGSKNGGVELITTNLEKQCDMAINVLREVCHISKNNPDFFFTRGTPYHTGCEEDWENIISKSFPNKNGEENIGETLLINVDGVIFDLKHKTNSGNMPQSRAAGPVRDMVISILKETIQDRPKADVFIRSHVHQHTFVKMFDRTILTTPALQIWSKYGEGQCNGIVDFGFLICEVENGKIIKWIEHITKTPIIKEKVIKV